MASVPTDLRTRAVACAVASGAAAVRRPSDAGAALGDRRGSRASAAVVALLPTRAPASRLRASVACCAARLDLGALFVVARVAGRARSRRKMERHHRRVGTLRAPSEAVRHWHDAGGDRVGAGVPSPARWAARDARVMRRAVDRRRRSQLRGDASGGLNGIHRGSDISRRRIALRDGAAPRDARGGFLPCRGRTGGSSLIPPTIPKHTRPPAESSA